MKGHGVKQRPYDLSRLSRRTWVTTKKADRLQAHLDMYIAYRNDYKIV